MVGYILGRPDSESDWISKYFSSKNSVGICNILKKGVKYLIIIALIEQITSRETSSV